MYYPYCNYYPNIFKARGSPLGRGAAPRYRCQLFNGHRLGEISRLVNVLSFAHCDMVCKELQRNGCHKRLKTFERLRNLYHFVGNLAYRVVAFRNQCYDLSLSCLDFLNIAEHLLIHLIMRSYYHYRHIRVDKGDGTVLHLCSWVAFGMDVTDFLQFQSAFKRNRIVVATSQIKEIAGIGEGLAQF